VKDKQDSTGSDRQKSERKKLKLNDAPDRGILRNKDLTQLRSVVKEVEQTMQRAKKETAEWKKSEPAVAWEEAPHALKAAT